MANRLATKEFSDLFVCNYDSGKRIWSLKNPTSDKQKVFDILKRNGYYNLTIRTLIKHIADKNGAHMDNNKSLWIRMANQSSERNISAISAFATQMIYAATKQIDGLKDYLVVPQMMEVHNLDVL